MSLAATFRACPHKVRPNLSRFRMPPSILRLSPEPPHYGWVSTRPWIAWSTCAFHVVALLWLNHVGQGLAGYLLVGLWVPLFSSYQWHRITGTDRGIELRSLWWREVIAWSDVASVESRPKHKPNAILIAGRRDPPWLLVIGRSSGRPLVV